MKLSKDIVEQRFEMRAIFFFMFMDMGWVLYMYTCA